MKKLVCAALALTLLFGSALAASIQLTNGPVTVRVGEDSLSLDSFHILGTDPDGNYRIYDGSHFYTIDAATLRHTAPFSSEIPALGALETLSIGSMGEGVIALQTGLKTLGYLRAAVDGDFGNRTQTAVKAFQEAAGLEITGEADEITQLLVASMSGETEYIEGTSNPEILFAPILGRTKIDLQPIMDAGLTLTYSELDGTGFISNGKVEQYDASGAADLDKYVLSVQFGLYVWDDEDAVEIVPAM